MSGGVSRRDGHDIFFETAMRREQLLFHRQQILHHQLMQRAQMEAMRRGVPVGQMLPPIPAYRNFREAPPAGPTFCPGSSSTAPPPPPPPPRTSTAPPPPPPSPDTTPPPEIPSLTNLEKFIQAVTPSVLVSQVSRKKKKNKPPQSFFKLEDLWDCYNEMSSFGVGVPMVLNGGDRVDQYYTPFLSGIQLYVDPAKYRFLRPNEEGGAEESGTSALSERLLFQYYDREKPHLRKTLINQVKLLLPDCPELMTFKSSDLLPSSWLAVAWYPIYRIPIGSTLKDVETSFLTIHQLAMPPPSAGLPPPSAGLPPPRRVSLPVFGLASYRFKGSLVSPGEEELKLEDTLAKAAEEWFTKLNVFLHDFHFFRPPGGHRR